MKKGLTELVFILDKSGSMSGLESDTIGGFNSMLKKQQEGEGECRITTILFNDSYELLHDRIDIKAVREITDKEYQVGGSTALLDAIGMTINKIKKVQENTGEDYRAGKVMFVIITDGEENSSREYSAAKVKAQIEEHKEKHGWEFIFLGANIDAVEAAGHLGINADRSVDYNADSIGIGLNYDVMSRAIRTFRETGIVNGSYLDEIGEDAKQRGRHKKDS